MKFIISIVFFLLSYVFVNGQKIDTKWYSETTKNGITIQNSFPKGGPYTSSPKKHFNYSYLVFFTRVVNGTQQPLELSVNFPADSIAIPNSPDTFVKLFLPSDTMRLDKQNLFSYGITELESFDKPAAFQRTVNPKEDCLFYVVAVFYQTTAGALNQGKGGNRAKFILEGQHLYFNMSPQIDSLQYGHIILQE